MPVTLFLSPSTLVRSKDHILGMLPEAQSYCDSSTLHYLLRARGIEIPMGAFDLTETIGLARDVFERVQRLGLKIVVVGGTESEWAKFRQYLVSTFNIDGANIFGIHGYERDLLDRVLALIREAHPQVVILGLGAPMQEYVARQC